jgi:hypothetical protein
MHVAIGPNTPKTHRKRRSRDSGCGSANNPHLAAMTNRSYQQMSPNETFQSLNKLRADAIRVEAALNALIRKPHMPVSSRAHAALNQLHRAVADFLNVIRYTPLPSGR